MAQQPSDHEEMKDKKCNDLYSDHDLAILQEFVSLLDDCESRPWNTSDDNKNSDDENIKTKYIKQGAYNVPISLSTAELDFNIDCASLSQLFIKDKHVINKFHTLVNKNVVIHNFNAVNRISQFQVKNINNFWGIANRDFIVREIGFCIKPDGTLLHYKELENINYKYNKDIMKKFKYQSKFICLLCSLDKTSKYYRRAMRDHARGIMYRCGICFENTGQNKSKISAIMEYDTGGDVIVSFIANQLLKQNDTSVLLCKDTIAIAKLLQQQEEEQEKHILIRGKSKTPSYKIFNFFTTHPSASSAICQNVRGYPYVFS